MNNYLKLANKLRKRDNLYFIGVCVGEIISLTPVTIQIYCMGVPLDFTDFFCVEGLINGGEKITTGNLYVEKYPVEIGDKFICITGNDNQSLFVLGKVENTNDLNIYLK